MRFVDFVALAAQLFEAAGVGTMVVGAGVSVALVLRDARSAPRAQAYRQLRHYLGRAILLGLELLVAADIIRTVAGAPTLRQVVILGLIVLIRTFLSFTLEVEVDGRWPWQSRPRNEDGAGPRA
ncbi:MULTISPECIES: DUF1622 domain-containing protein [unclassified Corallococcus]|uniref:DUF1622 domain-containing protein n=1 Tax=unclassified Corallococcus TaxID=2685029 RepID=UPI001A9048A2|nr:MULTISPECIES: DUF1622 domain-containing protein [unclassified Corallococcus]MBN9686047.1 DUF1622 domain-containing protein [Corallococcus sp. NCSPR001]WAS82517.1 DUF1622 domain-containing protein [Corallococcus sp. NCRR]